MTSWSQNPNPAIPGQNVTLCLLDAVSVPAAWTLTWAPGGDPIPIDILEVNELCVTLPVPNGAFAGLLVDDTGEHEDQTVII